MRALSFCQTEVNFATGMRAFNAELRTHVLAALAPGKVGKLKSIAFVPRVGTATYFQQIWPAQNS